MTLGSANAAVPAGSLIRSFNSDAMFPDVEQEREKTALVWPEKVIFSKDTQILYIRVSDVIEFGKKHQIPLSERRPSTVWLHNPFPPARQTAVSRYLLLKLKKQKQIHVLSFFCLILTFWTISYSHIIFIFVLKLHVFYTTWVQKCLWQCRSPTCKKGLKGNPSWLVSGWTSMLDISEVQFVLPECLLTSDGHKLHVARLTRIRQGCLLVD